MKPRRDMNAVPPELCLPQALRTRLLRYGPSTLAKVEGALEVAGRRCLYATSERVAEYPLNSTGLVSLFRSRTSKPVMSALESKFGGTPYFDDSSTSWDNFAFIGQINFAALEEPPPGAPSCGILALDLGEPFRFRVRWYPAPDESDIVRAPNVQSVGSWEARMRFSSGWSLPGGKAWDSIIPSGDDELWELWNDWEPEGYLEDESYNYHRVLGHRSAGLDEHGVPDSRNEVGATDIQNYEMLWRITSDRAAGLDWGTNWIYVIIHSEDFAAGRFDRAIAVVANY